MNDMRKFIKLVEDCDETPKGGEDGECSPFTHADENVEMVREDDFEPQLKITCPECGDFSMDLQDQYDDEFFYVCNTCGAEETDSLSRTVIGEPPAPEDALEEDDEDDYHETEVRRFMDMGKRDLWILYNDTLEANDPEDHDALQYMNYALRQMGVHVAEDIAKEDFLIPPKDRYDAEQQDAKDRFADNYADDMADRATTGPDFEDDEDDDWKMQGGEDNLGAFDRDMSDSEPFSEQGPGDEDDFDADPDAMVDVGDDEDYEEFDFDNEFERMMGNTTRFEAIEMNELRKRAGLAEKKVVTKDDIIAAGGVVTGHKDEIAGGPGTSTRHDGSDEVQIRVAKGFPNIRKWWKEDPEDIMSVIYWQKDQLPPPAGEAFDREWEKVKANLTKRYGDGEMTESAPQDTDDSVAFDFNDEKAYYLVADEIGDRISFGMHDEILVPEQFADKMIALLTDNGFEKGEAYSIAGMEEDLQNGYNDRASVDDYDTRFPLGATSSPAAELGPAGAKHGDNPMRTPMGSVDKKEDEVYESYRKQYRRFRNK